MTREDFYHSRPITFLQRLISIGYSTCECCGMPWNFVRKHGGEHTIMINKYEGFFPVCEYCWTHKSYKQNKSAVTELIKKWNKCGVRHYNLDIYSNAFEEDWSKTHNSKKNKMEEKITAWVARDEDNRLYLYICCKPCKNINNGNWIIENDINGDAYYKYIPNDNYPQVTWKDDEPTEVELAIKICE